MKFGRRLALLTVVTLALGGPVAAVAATTASAAAVASDQGWVRCANLAPGTPQDVILYPFGNPGDPIELSHDDYGYGTVSDYMPVTSGQYTVAIRADGSSASSTPSVSTSFMVSAGTSYTVASIGSGTTRKLEVLQDQAAGAAGAKVLVRVVQASLKQTHVTVSVGSDVVANQLALGSASAYQQVPAGKTTVTFDAAGGHVSMPVTLAAGSVHSIFVLDGSSGLRIDNVTDAAGSADTPRGGAATGFGGTAPPPGPRLTPWVGTLAGGALLVAAGVFALRRSRRTGLPLRD
jgi:Domain of unknown function (DUF4397)